MAERGISIPEIPNPVQGVGPFNDDLYRLVAHMVWAVAFVVVAYFIVVTVSYVFSRKYDMLRESRRVSLLEKSLNFFNNKKPNQKADTKSKLGGKK